MTQVVNPETDSSPSGVSSLLTVDCSVGSKNAEAPKPSCYRTKRQKFEQNKEEL